MAHKPTSKPVVQKPVSTHVPGPKIAFQSARQTDHVRVAHNERQQQATKPHQQTKVNESTNTTGPKGS